MLMSATEDYLLTMKLMLFIILSLKVSKNTEILWDYMYVWAGFLFPFSMHFVSVAPLSDVTMSYAELIHAGLNHVSPQ